METKELIADLREALSQLKEKQHDSVSLVGLENYLSHVEQDASSSFETRKLQHQGSLATYDARIKLQIESFKATIESGKEALNSIILINGGAVISILSFLAAVAVKGTEEKLAAWLTLPLLQFGLGVLLGSFGFGLKYVSQAFYTAESELWGNSFRNAAIVFGLLAYTAFALGVGNTYLSFRWRYAP